MPATWEEMEETLAPWGLAADQNEKRNFENTAHGSREIGTVGGGITGTRCGGLIVDDAYDAKAATDGTPAQVAERMAFVVGEYDSNWLNRVHPIYGWRVTIMQGLAEGDLADVLTRRGVRCVILPMEADHTTTIEVRPLDGSKPYTKPMRHPRDPRAPGGLLFPWLYSAEWCASMRATAGGARIWGPQYQQIRDRLGGKLFPSKWFGIPAPAVGVQRYNGPPERLARGLDAIGITMDCTFKGTQDADRVSVQAWGWKNDSENRFLLDRDCRQMDIAAAIGAAIGMKAKWNGIVPGRSMVVFMLVEATANGPAIIRLCEGRGLIGYNPRGSKYARAQITSYKIQAGCIWYPMHDHASWLNEVERVHVNFTGAEGGDDDDIDAESQIVIYLDDAAAVRHEDPLAKLKAQLGFVGGKGRR